ncbi:tumor necrosis factor receptor superfamily member 5-like [Hemitrygon akajei]|uniref:tumor necrosis factor receptor superfamily member 5-like n=1 Tax=Hemitrygon akajei TaxID=2704970 RepID=UPI003BF94834
MKNREVRRAITQYYIGENVFEAEELENIPEKLGLQVKQDCTYSRNTICEPREGYYCIDSWQVARKHTECPPGKGVKEKGTPFKDTVCEKCPDGTFSSEASTTEECKNWTVCETLNLKQVEPGSAEADVKCEAVSNLSKVAFYVVPIILVVILGGIVTCVLWRKLIHKTGNQTSQSPRNHNGDGKVMQPLTDEEKTLRDEERAE